MLDKKQVAQANTELTKLFGHAPDIHVRVRGGVATYEVMCFAPRCNNVGRGESLPAAIFHLKQQNGLA